MSGKLPNKFVIPSSKEMDEVNRQNLPKAVNSVAKEYNSAKKVESIDPLQPIQSSSHLSIDNFSAVENSSSVKPVNVDGKVNDSSEYNSISNDIQANESVATTVSKVPVSFPTLAKLGNTNSVIVNPRQRGNPILKHIRNIPWEYGNIIPDYVMGQATCALFLSLRYHQLHPSYVHDRLKTLGRSFDLRVLLVQVDLADPHYLLKNLSKICILANCTLMLAFTAEEAGRYLETYKIYENKSPEAIMEKTDGNFMTKLTDCFTTIKSVNKTDCTTLISSFKTIKNIIQADKEDLGLCPGFGPQKAKRLSDVVHEPFVKIRKY